MFSPLSLQTLGIPQKYQDFHEGMAPSFGHSDTHFLLQGYHITRSRVYGVCILMCTGTPLKVGPAPWAKSDLFHVQTTAVLAFLYVAAPH